MKQPFHFCKGEVGGNRLSTHGAAVPVLRMPVPGEARRAHTAVPAGEGDNAL